MITAHTDVVGSLLRPVALRKARDEWAAGRLSRTQFKSIEDRAVDEAVSLQEAAGLDIVTDGEMRRLSFQSQMTEAVEAPEELIRRITQASLFVPLERLALSPQCGFASSVVGNDLSIEDQRRKLETVCETARRIWK